MFWNKKKKAPLVHSEPLNPIKDLKEGEKLERVYPGYDKVPLVGEIVTISEVFEPECFCEGDGYPEKRYDFKAFVDYSDGIKEYKLDSRYFKRVE